MSTREWKDFVEDILAAIDSIAEFTAGMKYEDFFYDKKTSFAVVRSIEIIGEAAKNIPESIRRQYPDIPWKDMAGMRDKVIHHYFGVELKVVWKTIKEDIPLLKPSIEQIIETID